MGLSRLLVFTDLDGTLLDYDTYAFDAAEPALDRLRRERIPFVLCSSKTRAEIEAVRTRLRNEHPFVSENGGGVFIPRGYFPHTIDGAEERGVYTVLPLGEPYADLTAALDRASRVTGVAIRGFSAMTDDDRLVWRYAVELNAHKSVSDVTYRAALARCASDSG